MSKEIDERVVEMRFDNEHFEKNVQTSMSTLDKFKEKLKFKNAGKGFDDIEKSAKNTDLSPLAKSADKVGLRFNAMYTVADQAFRNITNSAMAAGKRIVDALTIDPVKTGLQEYETKMNAVQVIQANTRGKDTMEDITAALEELNVYADKTIYNFAQMTSNVGKFTAQGYRAKEAANAVKGLANLAAASGASAEDMARATYQMSQALGGTIRLMDWNSLRNANMATVDLKNTLIDLAKVNGIAIDDMIAKHGTFEQTLSEGWLSGSMFTEAMNIYSGIYSEAELKAKGFTDKQVENFMDLAKMAESAATEVKTFTQLFDVLKETAQSGWTQTWEIIFGDFPTAKKMFTELQVYFGDFLNAMSEARNMLLEGAFNLKNPWSKIKEKLEASNFGKVVQTFDKVKDSVEDASETLERFQKVVNDVWRGDYKNADTGRFELLEAAGYNSKVVQDLVNKGYDYKLTVEDIEESHKKFGLSVDGSTAAMEDAGQATEGLTVKYNELTDAQLEQAGLTKEEIKLFRALADEAERQGVTMLYLVDEMSKNDGRTLLIDSFKNAWEGLVAVLLAVKDAWVDIFPPMTVVQLYNIIKAINKFSEHLIVHEKTQEKLTRTLKGVFAALDIILTLVSLPMKIAFKALTQLLGVLDVDILSVTASVGDALVAFRDWIDRTLDFTKVFEKIVPPIKSAIKAFAGWIESLKESKNLPQDIAKGIIRWFGKAYDAVIGWFKNLGSGLQNGFSDAGDNVVIGLLKGLWNGIKVAGEVIIELGKTLIAKICDILGIQSPSTVFMAIGGFIISGLLIGIRAAAPELWKELTSIGGKCIDIIQGGLDVIIDGLKNVDLGSILSAVTTTMSAVAILKIANAIKNVTNAFEGFGDMMTDVGVGVKRALSGLKFRMIAAGIKDIAISIAILAGSIAVLSLIPPERLITATLVIATLGVILKGLATTTGSVDPANIKDTALKMGQLIGILMGVSVAVLLLAIALNSLTKIDFANNWVNILVGMILIVGTLSLLLREFKVAANTARPKDIARLGAVMSSMAGILLMLALVVKIMDSVSPGGVVKSIVVIGLFGLLILAVSSLSTNMDPKSMKIAQLGSLIKNIGMALLLMAVSFKILGGMELGELGKGILGIGIFAGIVVGLMAATKLATDKDVSKAGKLISSVGGAMLMMAFTAKIIATMSWGDMVKAAIGIAAFGGVVVGLIAATKLATDKELKRVGTTLLMMSVSIGIMGLVASLLSFMDVGALIKGVTTVGILGLVVVAMVKATEKAQDCMKNLIVMSAAIFIMTAAVASLSLIKTEKLIPAVASMVLMMGMFAVMIASTKFITTDKTALLSLGAMVLVVAALGAVVWGLSELVKDTSKALTATIALSMLMVALTGSLAIISKLKVDFKRTGAQILALTAMVIPLAAFALALNYIPTDNIADKGSDIILITSVMVAMTGLVAVLSLMKLNVASLQAIGIGLVALAEVLGGIILIVGILGLLNTGGHLESFVNKGISLLVALAKGLGEVIAAFLGGLLTVLPTIGTLLSEFIVNIQGFIDGVGSIDVSVLTGALILVGAIAAVLGLCLISGVGALLGGGLAGFVVFITGLKLLSEVIKDFAKSMGDFTDDQVDAVKRGAEALKAIAEAAAAIPNSGGVAGFFAGNNDLNAFVEMLADSMGGIKSFIESVKGVEIKKKHVTTAERVGDMLVAIADAASKIPNTGGIFGDLVGSNDLDAFLKMVVGDSENGTYGIQDLVNILGGMEIPNGLDDKVQTVVSIITDISKAASKIPNSGGVAGFFAGDNTMANVAKDLGKFCDEMKKVKKDTLSNAISKMSELLSLFDSFTTDSVSNLADFGKALKDIAKGGIDKFNEAFTSKSSTGDAKKAINTFITTVAEAVKTKKNKKKFSSVGKYLVQGLANGISNNASLAATAMQGVVDAVEAAAKSKQGFDINSPSKKFVKVGKSVDEGLAEGITDNEDLVDNAMTDLTDNLLDRTESDLDINSPSLVYNEVGRLIVEGLAEGIEGADSAEIAFQKKLANIYKAWSDWNKSNPDNQLTFAQAFGASNLVVPRSYYAEAKDAGYTNVYDYIKAIARDAISGTFSGKEKSVEDALEDVEYEYSESIEKFEKNIKGSQSELRVKNSKLNFFKSDEERVQTEIEALEYQNEQREGLIKTLEAARDSYSTKTNIQMDDNIISWNNEIADIQEEMAEADARLEELRTQQATAGGEEAAAAAIVGSPLLKYSKQLGHHVVENIAHGIKEDMSAEEQAKQKAQNINDAFQEQFDAINTEKEKYELEYQNWELNNPDATQSQKDTQLLKSLNNQLSVLKTAEEYAKSEYLETKRILGENAKETKTAYNDWIKAQNEVASKRKEITDTRKEHYERDKQEQEDYAKRMEAATDERRKSDYDIWVAENQNASEELKHTKKLEYLNAELVDAEDDFAKSKREYLKLLKQNNDVYTPEVLEARNKAREDRLRVAELTNDIVEEDKAFLEYLEEVQDELIDTEYNLWLEQNRNASEEVKRAKNLEYLNQKLVEATEDTIKSEAEYKKLLEEYNDEEAPAVKAALIEYNKNAKEQAELENSITDAKEEAVAAAEERKGIAYRIAKLKYDIWEKTAGRDATDEEKEAKQLEYLSQQYSIQTQRLRTAAEEYNKAVADYGSNTTEANRAYEKMLNESYSLAELQDQILDLQESAEDRKKRLRDKQDLAYRDYKDYIKRYEKYYLANGMSREDLERDAKLVSGYDPTNVVGTITKKTETAVENVETSLSYQNILSSFTDMGMSYVDAINTGITEQSVDVSTTVIAMVDACLASIRNKQKDWKKAGAYLVDGFASGITINSRNAVSAATTMAVNALKAAKKSLSIESPSKAFAEVGRYSVLGFANSLIDNSKLAENAASEMGNKAIENLQNTIKQIAKVVDSDLDTQPTIRPVLDLSNVRSGTARLNAMMSQSQAIAISASRQSRERNDENQNGNDSSTNTGNTYQFTQNNYSPKALSRTEIYRQTKNQFTALKEVLT